jgi:hypothetical protein
LHFEQIAGLRPVDPDRTGQRMRRVQVPSGRRRSRAARTNLAIERIERIEDRFVARIEPEDGRDRRMPAVVALPGLACQPPGWSSRIS